MSVPVDPDAVDDGCVVVVLAQRHVAVVSVAVVVVAAAEGVTGTEEEAEPDIDTRL